MSSRVAGEIVIVGGGFAGLKCAMELAAHSGLRITLIDKNSYQQFHPLLYQVAAGLLSPENVGVCSTRYLSRGTMTLMCR